MDTWLTPTSVSLQTGGHRSTPGRVAGHDHKPPDSQRVAGIQVNAKTTNFLLTEGPSSLFGATFCAQAPFREGRDLAAMLRFRYGRRCVPRRFSLNSRDICARARCTGAQIGAAQRIRNQSCRRSVEFGGMC